jgi:site-specific DNA-methyltransferase (adenine-specific)
MTKTVTIKNCILHNMDCMDLLKATPDKFYDLAIVDPPYNIVSQQKRGIGSRIDPTGKMNDWNNIKPTPEYFAELMRVSKFQIVWGANNFTLPESEYFIVWDKNQSVDNFASAEYAWTNFKMPAKVFRYSIHQTMSDRKDEGGKIHPTQKPVKLYEWLLTNYAKQGDKILDTHLGSGSHAIACNNLGFELTACELDSDYFEASIKRITQATAQERLFE